MVADETVFHHAPVLLEAAVDALRIRRGGTYVDATAGGGGHAEAIARRLDTGRLIALDRDRQAVARVRARLAPFPWARVIHRNYAALAAVLAEEGIPAIDGCLIDAGLSSDQLDDPMRGFSFERLGPLDMRMDDTAVRTAADFLAETTEQELVDVLKRYGDLKPARRIARAILRRRAAGTLATTADLAAAVHEALDFVAGQPEETRTVFQAIRIAVNDELACLEQGLRQAVAALAPEGRLVVLTFHSGEDRVAKNVLRDASRLRRIPAADGRVAATVAPRLRLVTKKPLRPSADEVRQNPRAHSARMRVAEGLAERSGEQ